MKAIFHRYEEVSGAKRGNKNEKNFMVCCTDWVMA